MFLEYSDSSSCASAKDALGGRKFAGNTVTAVYYAEDKFYNGDYGAWIDRVYRIHFGGFSSYRCTV